MPAKKTAKKAAAKKTAAKKAVTKKTTAKTAKKAAGSSPAAKASSRPSPDSIAKAAYLNYRRRVEQGLPGDSHGDWLEAEKRLGED